jgi:predicted oxidoreductase (fatty acid repression mutant protein)
LLPGGAHWLLAGLILSAVSCRKPVPAPVSSEPGPASAEQKDSSAYSAKAAPASARPAAVDPDAQAAEERAVAETLQFYNGLLREFVADHKRFPKTFKEFESVKVDSPRRPPPGKRWDLDPNTKRVVVMPAAK